MYASGTFYQSRTADRCAEAIRIPIIRKFAQFLLRNINMLISESLVSFNFSL